MKLIWTQSLALGCSRPSLTCSAIRHRERQRNRQWYLKLSIRRQRQRHNRLRQSRAVLTRVNRPDDRKNFSGDVQDLRRFLAEALRHYQHFHARAVEAVERRQLALQLQLQLLQTLQQSVAA